MRQTISFNENSLKHLRIKSPDPRTMQSDFLVYMTLNANFAMMKYMDDE